MTILAGDVGGTAGFMASKVVGGPSPCSTGAQSDCPWGGVVRFRAAVLQRDWRRRCGRRKDDHSSLKMRAKSRQLELPTGGGRRKGAGRKPGPRSKVSHRRRPEHGARFPVHVVLRTILEIPSLRHPVIFAAVRAAIAAGCSRLAHPDICSSVFPRVSRTLIHTKGSETSAAKA